ncbi:MAG: hypothetical protein ACRDZ5_10650, partial [Acidimicrobiales bacterium]
MSGGTGVASSLTAMKLLGFDPTLRQRGRSEPVHVLSASSRRQRPQDGIIVHRVRTPLRADEVVERGPVRLTSPCRTLPDVAESLSLVHLERFIGHLIATRQVNLVELDRLHA